MFAIAEAIRNGNDADDSHGDMSHDLSRAAPRGRAVDDRIVQVLVAMEDRIEALEGEITSIGPLVDERDRLLRARALILGEPEPSPGLRPARRITRDQVAAIVKATPGLPAGQIADALGAGREAVSAHLARGKGERFELRSGGWYLAGISPS